MRATIPAVKEECGDSGEFSSRTDFNYLMKMPALNPAAGEASIQVRNAERSTGAVEPWLFVRSS